MNRHFHALAHVQSRIISTPLTETPYRHLLVEDAFPADYYDEMLAHFPDESEMRHPKRAREYPEILECDLVADPGMEHHASGGWLLDNLIVDRKRREFWGGFRQAFFRAEALSATLVGRLAKLLREKARLVDGGFYTCGRLAIDMLGAGLGPHVDRTDKLVSAIFSLAPHDVSDEDAHGSGTWLLAPKEPDFDPNGVAHLTYDLFDHPEGSTMAEWRPNRLLCWAVTRDSFHAYHQRADIKRRTIKLFVQANVDREAVHAEIAGTTDRSEDWRKM